MESKTIPTSPSPSPSHEINEFVVDVLEQFVFNTFTMEVGKKKCAALIDNLLAKITSYDIAEKQKEVLWNRVFSSIKNEKLNAYTKCLLFSKILSAGHFPNLTGTARTNFIARLASFYGSNSDTAFRTVENEPSMQEELMALHGLLTNFVDEHANTLLFKAQEKQDSPTQENLKHLVGIAKQIKKLQKLQKEEKRWQRQFREENTVRPPSNAAYAWAGVWRCLLLPLSFAEGVARIFDQLAQKIWEEAKKSDFSRFSFIPGFLFQAVNFAGLLLFAPEKLIQRCESKWLKGLIRVANIAAWIGIGFAFPPLFAKLGVSLPFVSLGAVEISAKTIFSASQVFWMSGLAGAYAIRQGCQSVGEKCFDWGGKGLKSEKNERSPSVTKTPEDSVEAGDYVPFREESFSENPLTYSSPTLHPTTPKRDSVDSSITQLRKNDSFSTAFNEPNDRPTTLSNLSNIAFVTSPAVSFLGDTESSVATHLDGYSEGDKQEDRGEEEVLPAVQVM